VWQVVLQHAGYSQPYHHGAHRGAWADWSRLSLAELLSGWRSFQGQIQGEISHILALCF